MLHRHLTHQQFALAGIDDIIARGNQQDWIALRWAALGDRTILDKIMRVCRARIADPYAQRYHFWMHYAQEHMGESA